LAKHCVLPATPGHHTSGERRGPSVYRDSGPELPWATRRALPPGGYGHGTRLRAARAVEPELPGFHEKG